MRRRGTGHECDGCQARRTVSGQRSTARATHLQLDNQLEARARHTEAHILLTCFRPFTSSASVRCECVCACAVRYVSPFRSFLLFERGVGARRSSSACRASAQAHSHPPAGQDANRRLDPSQPSPTQLQLQTPPDTRASDTARREEYASRALCSRASSHSTRLRCGPPPRPAPASASALSAATVGRLTTTPWR